MNSRKFNEPPALKIKHQDRMPPIPLVTVSSITLHGGSCPSCLHSHSSNKVEPYSTCLHSAVTQMLTSIDKRYFIFNPDPPT